VRFPGWTRGSARADSHAAVLGRLLDESSIRALLARYARAIDRIDLDLLRSCYHPDAVDVHGYDYDGDVEGFAELLGRNLPRNEWTMHVLGGPLIEIEGDTAWTETYCIALHRLPATEDEPAREHVRLVRYCDRLERRGGEWRIARRTAVYEGGRVDPIGPSTELVPPALARRDRHDPAYAREHHGR
jgi:ketosteroid isomerase-like protein